MGRITFRIGPRDLRGTVCATCGKVAIYLLARPYDLKPGGEIATPSCAEHAMSYPQWVPGGVGAAMDGPASVVPAGGAPADDKLLRDAQNVLTWDVKDLALTSDPLLVGHAVRFAKEVVRLITAARADLHAAEAEWDEVVASIDSTIAATGEDMDAVADHVEDRVRNTIQRLESAARADREDAERRAYIDGWDDGKSAGQGENSERHWERREAERRSAETDWLESDTFRAARRSQGGEHG